MKFCPNCHYDLQAYKVRKRILKNPIKRKKKKPAAKPYKIVDYPAGYISAKIAKMTTAEIQEMYNRQGGNYD